MMEHCFLMSNPTKLWILRGNSPKLIFSSVLKVCKFLLDFDLDFLGLLRALETFTKDCINPTPISVFEEACVCVYYVYIFTILHWTLCVCVGSLGADTWFLTSLVSCCEQLQPSRTLIFTDCTGGKTQFPKAWFSSSDLFRVASPVTNTSTPREFGKGCLCRTWPTVMAHQHWSPLNDAEIAGMKHSHCGGGFAID